MAQFSCRNPHCDNEVPPNVLACRKCWLEVPPELRQRVFETYEARQEIVGSPKEDYKAAVRAVLDWWESS